MQYTWNGNDGSYTDATQWMPEGVPLYDGSDSAVIQSGTVTLSNAAPNNIAMFLGGTDTAAQPNLVLDNAALGSDVQLRLSQPASMTQNLPITFATITVQGYDTNYGTISLGEFNPSLKYATIAIAPYSQLNQEGTIVLGNAPTLQITKSSDAPGALNNDGTIQMDDGGSVAISADVTGSGTIAFTALTGTRYGSSRVELGGGVSSSQHISFQPGGAGTLRIDDPSAFHGTIDGFAFPYSSIAIANTQATGAYFAQVTPDSGALLVLNGQQVVDALTVTGAHASNVYGVSSNADGSTTVAPVFPLPATS